MQRRQKDIFAGVLLLLVLPLSWQYSKLSFEIVNYWRGELGITFIFQSLSAFLTIGAEILFVIIPVLALVAGILAFIGQSRKASVLAAISMLLMLLSFVMTFVYYFRTYNSAFLDIGKYFMQIVLGIDVLQFFPNSTFHWLSHIPVLLLLGISAALLYSKSSSTKPSEPPYAFQPPVSAPAPATEIPYGAKKCPECAELIQVDAIKCRFCNYRYS